MPTTIRPQASDARQAGLSISNDAHFLTLGLLLDEDRYYSQGLHAFWLSNPCSVDSASSMTQIFAHGLNAYSMAWGIDIGQEIFTPNDLRMFTPLADDRPFVGWTHLDLSQRYYFKNEKTKARLHTQLILGVVGPKSWGSDLQIEWHRVRRQSSSHPELDPEPTIGWSHQLGNTGFPGKVQIGLNYAMTFPPVWTWKNFKIESGTDAGLNAGSLYGNLEIGGQIRMGWLSRNLNQPQFSGNGKGWESFIFGHSRLRANGWNATLTGGLSSDVDLAPFTLQHELGTILRASRPIPRRAYGLSASLTESRPLVRSWFWYRSH